MTAPALKKIGLIGLGAMGVGMARNLHKHGLLAGVWNRTASKTQAVARETGCVVAQSPTDLAPLCDAIVLCVSADADVLGVVDALLPNIRRDAVVIDCSTVSADTARSAAHRLRERGAFFIDAPVSGGVEGARDGALAIMCGGDAQAFERARPVLEAMGKTVTHFGASGMGQAAKATNQIMCAGVIQAVAEAMAFAKAEELPLDKLIETLGKGAGSSWYFVNRAPNIVRDSYPAGFRVRLHDKDLKICRAMAARHGVQLPLIEMTLVHYRRLIEQGHGDEDISTLFHLKDALFAAAASDPKRLENK
ncbi:3-hydroxyisobutyrate dehydrogenase [Povalibacter uvarum]|uniref:3-hydroxyisobutyrate dehydrogenase n=2 Tax=Povalibacter uvarum TaxID=732238 RepID=A0A841HKD8_9GAMM|nr:3-hydroxyisobutyrate dehydrogenase [Povalibacter uvarum]